MADFAEAIIERLEKRYGDPDLAFLLADRKRLIGRLQRAEDRVEGPLGMMAAMDCLADRAESAESEARTMTLAHDALKGRNLELEGEVARFQAIVELLEGYPVVYAEIRAAIDEVRRGI